MAHPALTPIAVLASGICFVVGWYIWGGMFIDGTILEKILLILLVVLVLFSGFLLYCIRMFLTYIWFTVWTIGKKPNPKLLLQDFTFRSFVLPSDLDVFLHMNNSRYARAADFARISLFFHSGINDFIVNHKGMWIMSANILRYRKSLQFLQGYTITTKLVYWEEDAFYLEHKYTSKYKDIENFVYCVMLCKISVRGVTTAFIRKNLLKMDEDEPLPEPSEEVKHFVAFNKESSEALRVKSD